MAGPALASASTPPINDNYLTSLEINRPHHRLDRVHTLKDVRDLTAATVQGNIFNPCGQASCPPGPPEVTSCNGVNYGQTVWYDFYPDANGTVSIRTSALFDSVTTLYTFNNNQNSPNYLLPSGNRRCTTSSFGSGQLIAPVKKGQAYTFQIGGVPSSQNPSGVSGPIEMLFDFFVPPPRRLSAQATVKARALSTGIQLLDLTVSTARGAHIQVSCGGFCRTESKSVPKFGQSTLDFPGLNGVRMPAGSKLKILVTAAHSIGQLIQYNILPGNFTKQTFCTEPGSKKPRRQCH